MDDATIRSNNDNVSKSRNDSRTFQETILA